jgi:hypothetical protein
MQGKTPFYEPETGKFKPDNIGNLASDMTSLAKTWLNLYNINV